MKRHRSWGPLTYEDGSMSFSLWAPALSSLSVDIDGRVFPMEDRGGGWFSSKRIHVPEGTTYMFVLPDDTRLPDPASRYQEAGVFGPSRFLSSEGFGWMHQDWKGRPWEEAVVYEIHVGTFTKEGTFLAAIDHLARLCELGFTAVEIMPLAQFPGQRGWGYDGVFQYAPHAAYGSPHDFRRLIDAAHSHGLMVFLDVVYNHFGPEGNFLPLYAPQFFRKDDPTPWGDKIDFRQQPVRRFFTDNVLYWLDEFRLDGLRLDAIDQIEDDGEIHILEEISEAVRESFCDRHVHLITENPANGPDLLADVGGGRRLFVADWNDDFHHALHVAVTGEDVGYYAPFSEDPWQQVKKTLAEGYLREGKASLRARNAPLSASLPPTAFVHFLQNHDQVGNRARGDRLNTILDERCHWVLTEILTLSPQIPLFFMGDDHLSTRAFHFFSDYDGELAKAVADNRPKEAENFGGFPNGSGPEDIPDPNDVKTFIRSRLEWDDAEAAEGVAWGAFLKLLLHVRRTVVVPLLADAKGNAGTVVKSEPDAVFVDWSCGGQVLRLRANPSEHVRRLDGDLGRLVYPTEREVLPGILEPWSTHLYIG